MRNSGSRTLGCAVEGVLLLCLIGCGLPATTDAEPAFKIDPAPAAMAAAMSSTSGATSAIDSAAATARGSRGFSSGAVSQADAKVHDNPAPSMSAGCGPETFVGNPPVATEAHTTVETPTIAEAHIKTGAPAFARTFITNEAPAIAGTSATADSPAIPRPSVTVETPTITGTLATVEAPALARKSATVEALEVAASLRYVNVSVATLWRTPGSPRQVDEPSLRAPADIPAWLAPQSIADKLQLVGRTETEVLYGEPVELLEERGDWARVVVPAQRTPLDERGYPGWLPKRQLTERSAASAYIGCSEAFIKKPTAWLYEDAALQLPRLQISFGTRLPIAQTHNSVMQVATPDGTAWLNAADAVAREPNGAPEQPPTGEQVIATGRLFLGLPYLWAGVSGFGFDCSGFAYSLYRYYGIELPRDAKDQAKAGRAADKRHLQPGDLLFFAYDKGKGAIHHVALYAGDGMILHSPKTERTVELIPLATPEYAGEFAAARRVLPDE